MTELNLGSTHFESQNLVKLWHNKYYDLKNKSMNSAVLDKLLSEIIKLAEKNKELLTACEGLLVVIKLGGTIDQVAAIKYAEEVLGITK